MCEENQPFKEDQIEEKRVRIEAEFDFSRADFPGVFDDEALIEAAVRAVRQDPETLSTSISPAVVDGVRLDEYYIVSGSETFGPYLSESDAQADADATERVVTGRELLTNNAGR